MTVRIFCYKATGAAVIMNVTLVSKNMLLEIYFYELFFNIEIKCFNDLTIKKFRARQ